uniref:MKRN2 opposite strand protein-like C-terminal domain-containing protein n=1 Tax=Trichuris muris TaxID=70415 RepID=A0A5S6Q4D5_TRIMR
MYTLSRADGLVLSRHSRCGLLFVFHPSRRNHCPRCSLPLLTGSYRKIAAPGADPQFAPCAVLLKPSFGDYCRTYKPGDSLHIGITDSSGAVFSYDRERLCVEKEGWSQSIVILTADQLSIPKKRWIRQLFDLLSTPRSLNQRQGIHSCFDFVLTFLRAVAPSIFERRTKEDIASAWIKCKIDKVWSFCVLFRWCLYANGVLVMADDMEDESSDDRLRDHADFMRHQLQLFKQTYTTARVDAEQASMQLGFEEGFDDYCQLARRLGKANGALEALRSARSNCYAEMKNRLASLLPDEETDVVESGEFNFEFAKSCLSSFDNIDMELLGVASLPERVGRSRDEPIQSSSLTGRSETMHDLLERFRRHAECLINATAQFLTSVKVDSSFLLG